MNCAVCGSPLLFDRVVFHCSCGVFVHSYCWDKHVLQAHKPTFEMGTVDLNDEFKAIGDTVTQEVEDKQVTTIAGEEIEEEIQEV